MFLLFSKYLCLVFIATCMERVYISNYVYCQ